MTDKAILLGINEYKKVNGLNGCVNDVENMRRLLVEQFGFNPTNVKVLLNENVVKSDVKKQMKWLFKDARSGDRLVFHFSGHGSYTVDLDGDEDDGADELICLYDMDFNDPETYFLDDDVRRWTDSLPNGVELTIVFDSCHSGTGTRLMMAPAPGKPHHNLPMRVDDRSTVARALSGMTATSRGLDAAPAITTALDAASSELVRVRFIDPPPAIKAAAEKRKKRPTRDLVRADMNHVLLAACRSDQTAADANIGGSPNGAFTYYLCDTIRTGGADLDRKELISRVEGALRDGHFSQIPQLEGPSPGGPLFRSRTTQPATVASVEAAPSGGGRGSAQLGEWSEVFRSIAGLTAEAQLEALRMVQAGAVVGLPQTSPLRAEGRRRLVYVHGICRHDAGYSNGWWQSLRPFTNAFGAGNLGDTRREVQWSDLVNERAIAVRAARATDPQAAREAEEQAELKREIQEALEDRIDRHLIEAAPRTAAGELPQPLPAERGLNIPGLNCLDDFTTYMVNEKVRAAVLERFTRVVKPLLESGEELDIISHSWGTVVAFEALRELAESGLTLPRVRNFFTVGAALSIAPVKMRLRPANRDGRRPVNVRRWVNINAHGDVVGGPLQGRPYQVDVDFPNVRPFGCGDFLGLVNPVCAHASYFVAGNAAVNREIFARFIERA